MRWQESCCGSLHNGFAMEITFSANIDHSCMLCHKYSNIQHLFFKEKQRTMDTLPHFALVSSAYNLRQMPEAVSIGAHFVRDLVRTSNASDYARTLVYIESLCDNNEAPKSSFAFSLDASLADVLQKPHLCCARTPVLHPTFITCS
ncbi:unnamed protein product [Cylicocyclus nassatus]|uniref:Uncharacterized protein n=1 Tax=Cylicocyclus nassatus TaxID=53992 RepID=A0AA36MAJ6_CYLNA|nr:unnamed protein product [Cylicocyclus nassatus]